MSIRISKEAQRVRSVQAELAVKFLMMLNEKELTSVESLQVLEAVEGNILGTMLRHERHPNDPEKGADEE